MSQVSEKATLAGLVNSIKPTITSLPMTTCDIYIKFVMLLDKLHLIENKWR